MTSRPSRCAAPFVLAIALVTCLLGTNARACDMMGVPIHDTVARLTSCVAKLEADVDQLTKQVAALQNQLAQAHQTENIVVVRTVKLDGLPKITAPLLSAIVQCPRGSWVSGIDALHADAASDLPILQRPARELRYSCRALK